MVDEVETKYITLSNEAKKKKTQKRMIEEKEKNLWMRNEASSSLMKPFRFFPSSAIAV